MIDGQPPGGQTMGDLYRTIWRVTARDQALLIGLSLVVAALAAAPLKFQQLVVNALVYGGDRMTLAWLCAGLLAAVLLSAALKFALNFKISVVGERVIRLIRERLYTNYVADTASGAQGVPSRGTLVTMLSAEAEGLGKFTGTAIASPLLQIGTLVSVLAFIAASQPWLGLLAVAVVVPQAVIVVALQARINARVRERLQSLRDVSARTSEADVTRIEDEILQDFHDIYVTRRRTFLLKLTSKLAMSAISGIGMVGILFLGGLLVLEGRSDVGTIVASITGLARIQAPWRELISFFRMASTMRVKFVMIFDAILARPTAVARP